MTDARFPSHWMHDARIQGLSGDHFRAFMHALAWSALNRTDGVIRFEHLPLIYRVDADAMAAFVNADLAAELDDGWLMTVYLPTQTTRAQFEAYERNKANARDRQAQSRANRNANKNAAQGHVTSDVTSDVPSHHEAGRQAGRLSKQGNQGTN